MKSLNVLAAAAILAVSGPALCQSWALNPNAPAVYDPAKGPLTPERRFVLTREGVEESRYNAQNPTVTQVAPVPQAVPARRTYALPERRTYALPERSAATVVSAPEWFVRLPEDAENMMFAAGTATSTDEQMAYDKARLHAERKLVEAAYSRIATQTNSYRSDNSGALTERFQQVTRKNARGELIGAQRVDSQVTHDGQTYKVYVLLRLPLGAANTLQHQRTQTQVTREAEIRGQVAERDMDAQDAQEQRQRESTETQLRQRLTPAPAPAPAPGSQQSSIVVTPLGASTVSSATLQLLEVDNEEYKRRREEALKKPGAVLGRITVQ